MPVQVGSPAPSFKLKAYAAASDSFAEVSLEEHRGHWVCLLFYPLAFSPLCPTELAAFNDAAGEFEKRECRLIACSVDSHFALRAWCKSDPKLAAMKYPLASDLTKRVAMDYGVLVADKGVALRGSFLIDPHGKLRAASVNDLMIGRSSDEILRLLDALRTGEPCPCNWKQGEPTLK